MTEPVGRIVPIVEGDGEVEAFRWLLRQMLSAQRAYDLDVAKPVTANGRGNVTVAGGVERFLEYAALRPRCRGVLVLVDADGDCPLCVTRNLTERATARGLCVPVALVVATRAYENWLVASIETIRGHCGIKEDAALDREAEGLGDAKGWLSGQMGRRRAYKESVDQFPLTRLMDPALVSERCRSFRRVRTALEFLVTATHANAPSVSPDLQALSERLERAAQGPR